MPFEPPCSADKGHDWDMGRDYFGYTGVLFNGKEIDEQFCRRRGCYVTRGVAMATLPDEAPDARNAPDRLYILYYGALCEYSVRVHQEEFGKGPGLEDADRER